MKKFLPLIEFIENELERYVAPTGRIGLSHTKYSATLYTLSDINLRKEAEILGVSYDLLRKWRSEKVFKSAVQKHAEKFSGIFIEELRRQTARPKTADNKLYDFKNYSWILRDTIIKKTTEQDDPALMIYLWKVSGEDMSEVRKMMILSGLSLVVNKLKTAQFKGRGCVLTILEMVTKMSEVL
jgi:hypothetical protein